MVAKVNICILVVEASSVLMICYAFLHFPQWTKNFKSMYIIASLSGPTTIDSAVVTLLIKLDSNILGIKIFIGNLKNYKIVIT